MIPQATVTVDLSDLEDFIDLLDVGMASGAGPFRDMYEQWGARYRAYVQERYDRYSRGGGDWPPLKHARRHGRGSRSRASILRDTNTMFAALNPNFTNNPGAYQEQISNGIEVGYGGPASHPNSRKLTVAGIAQVHDQGLGVNPERKIIVPPDARVVELMRSDAERAVTKAMQQSGLKVSR